MTKTVERVGDQTGPLERVRLPGTDRPAGPGAMLVRTAKMLGRLVLNWGVLLVAVTVVLIVRHRAESQARAPLPPPVANLTSADFKQWQVFPSFRGTVPVLLYHGVNSSGTGGSVSPQVFADQMFALKMAGFHAITLGQYVKFELGDRQGLPSRPILITFDDGRLATYRATTDILHRYGFHATMFTFAAWPTSNPGFSLTWGELRTMRKSGIWSVEEAGGSGHEYVVYDAKGDRGSAYAFLRYVPGPSGYGGHLESISSFLGRVTTSIRWGEQQFALQLPDYHPIAFAVGANYGQLRTNDPRIPKLVLPWLKQHFSVVFGGDYLDRGQGLRLRASRRSSQRISLGISMTSRTTLPVLYCRLVDWAKRVPVYKEYGCLSVQYSPPVWLAWHRATS